MWELDHKEGWVPENWCFQNVVLEKTLESPLDYMEFKSVNPKGNQHWIFIERIDVKAETQYFGHLMWRANSLEKTLMLGKIKGKKKRVRQRRRWLDRHYQPMDTNLSKLWEIVESRGAWRAACSPWVAKNQSQLRVSLKSNTQLWGVVLLHNL